MRFNYDQLETLWLEAGGDPGVAGLMASIALAESAGDPNATNHNSNSTTDRGLWQINTIWGSMSTYDIRANVKAAVYIYHKQGIRAWSTYNNGAYRQFYHGNTKGAPVSVPNGGGGGGGGGVGPPGPTSNVTPGINQQELAQQFGYAYSMLTGIPELNKVFQQAVREGWNGQRFTAALMGTVWWRTHSASQRAWIAQAYADPMTRNAQIGSQMALVQQMAAQIGASPPNNVIKQLAIDYMANGWNSARLQQELSKYIGYNQFGSLGGTAGELEMTLRNLAFNNGVKLSDKWIQQVAQAVAAEHTSIEDAEGYIRHQASLLFPQYSGQIKQGQNMMDLAQPYIQDYQRILEVSPNQTTLFDPTLLKALQWKPPTEHGAAVWKQGKPGKPGLPGKPAVARGWYGKGKNRRFENGSPAVPGIPATPATPGQWEAGGAKIPTQNSMPVWQFDQILRADPRWRKTQNAQDSMMNTARMVLKDWGQIF